MPPRFAYWTILAGGLPTSFRAADRSELLPTFHRIKEKHPDAQMKYFARGKLWDSAEEARRSGSRSHPGASGERRGRDWRPGGEHRDPRQPFKDAQQARNLKRRQQRWEQRNEARRPVIEVDRKGFAGPKRRSSSRRPPGVKPHGDKLRKQVPPGGGRRPRRPQERGGASRPSKPSKRGFVPKQRTRVERSQEPPPRPPAPSQEPDPRHEPKPEPPPRPSEPAIRPPGPPERGSAPTIREDSAKRPPEE